jgi:tetratricopeptide (TPR) repeat protein
MGGEAEVLLPVDSQRAHILGWRAPEDVAVVDCYECGCESPLKEYFQRVWSKGYMCQRCALQNTTRTALSTYALFLALGFLISIVVSHNTGGFHGYALINTGIFILSLLLIIPFHEAIHTLAAWQLQGRIFEVAMGAGPILKSRMWRGIRFSLRRHPFFGFCLAAFPQRQGLRWRWLIYIIAPLLVQSLLVLWLLPEANPVHFLTRIAILESFLFANLFLIAVNLFPWKPMPLIGTDGYWLFQLLTGSKALAELHTLYFLAESVYAMEYEDYQRMSDASMAGLALYPENDMLRNLQAVAYLAQERNHEALVLFEKFLETTPESPPSLARAMFLCNRAACIYAMVLDSVEIDADQMGSAHRSAAEAFWLLPWLSAVEIVRGLSFLYQGDPESALLTLQQSMNHQEKQKDKAETLGYIALAQHRLGQKGKAIGTLALAQSLAPQSPLFDKIESQMKKVA